MNRHMVVFMLVLTLIGCASERGIQTAPRTTLQQTFVQRISLRCQEQLIDMQLHGVMPQYPRTNVADGRDRHLLYAFRVALDGKIYDVVSVSKPDPLFDPEAKRAVRGWQVQFAAEHAECVAGRQFQVPIEFRLETY